MKNHAGNRLPEDQEYWDALLGKEGLGVIDGVDGEVKEVLDGNENEQNIFDSYELLFEHNHANESLVLKNTEGVIVGEIKSEPYILYGELKNTHLYMLIDDSLRKTGIAQTLYDLYSNLYPSNIPLKEYSQEISKIKFLLKNGYKVDSIYDGYDSKTKFTGTIEELEELFTGNNEDIVCYLTR